MRRDNVRSYSMTITALVAVVVFSASSSMQEAQAVNTPVPVVPKIPTINPASLGTQGLSGLGSGGIQAPQLPDVSGKINGLTSQLSQYTNQIGNLTQNLTSPLNGITGQLNGVTGQLSGITGASGITAGLTNQLGGLTGQLNGLTGQLGGVTNQLNGLTSQISAITGQLQGLTQSLTQQLSTITGQLSDITQGITSQLSGAESQLTSLTNQLSSINSQLNGLTNQLSGLSSVLGNAGQSLTNAVQSVQQEISQATQSINQASKALSNASQAASQAVNAGGQAANSIANISLGGGDNPKYDACPSPVCTSTTTPGKDTRYHDAIVGTASTGGSTPTNENPPATLGLQGAMKPIDNTTTPTDNPTGPIDPGLQGSMPHGIMPNKGTPAMSLVKNFPWLYKEIDSSYQGAPYYNYIGIGNAVYDKNVNSPSPNAVASAEDAAATAKLKPLDAHPNCGGNSTNYATSHIWARLQDDNYSNQYILSRDLLLPGTASSGSGYYTAAPGFIFDDGYRKDLYPYNETMCQPMHLKPVPCIQNENGVGPSTGNCKQDLGSDDKKLYDYRAWGYLQNSWMALMSGNNYTPNGGASGNDYGNPPVLTGSSGVIKGPNVPIPGGAALPFASPTFVSPYIGGAGAGDTSPYTGNNPTTDNQTSRSGLVTSLADLVQHSYERIWDPTHPFSPRWDFAGNDRDYSNIARLNGDTWHGYDPSSSQCIVRCAAVPVDILSFRYKEFDNCMRCRINVNTACFWTQVDYLETTLEDPPCPGEPQPQAVQDTINDQLGCHIVGLGNMMLTCKTTLSFQNLWPPCSTKFDHHLDNVPPMCNGNVPANFNVIKIDDCIADANDNNPHDGVKKCCDDLAHAVAPLNTLKIRNIKENPELQPIPEGYAFIQYFGNHMPYMRWWDSGTAAGGTTDYTGEQTNYNPSCDLGQYDVLVGVGIEGKSCKYGGGAGLSYECINVPATDALTSWSELKKYQSTSIRNYGLNCLPQYEKIYKPFGTEDGPLSAAGGYFIAPFPVFDSSGNVVGSESKTVQWPLSWRGYLSDPATSTRFPMFGASGSGLGGSSFTGLDNVKVGDIIYLTHDDPATQPNPSATPGSNTPSGANDSVMPFMAIVTGVNFPAGGTTQCDSFITVSTVNNGKYPDACGNTNYAGMGIDQPRFIYKNSLPPSTLNSLYPPGTTTGAGACLNTTTSPNPGLNQNNQGNCNDPQQKFCTFGETIWNAIHVYRPTQDVRSNN